ncbi:hypothetical protein M514_11327 [Trichuris suis]|uniref:RRM domain-containing protein n=1 Tax=Trichuris suis TaxID=68888 RepID=A0A085MR69_9BILA|nr:hypothetical protein M514_11327 [Trichuris suis]
MPSIVISNYSISAKLLLEVLLVMGTRVYIGRLPYRATERDIERFFRGYGRIREIFLKNGYGFIEFEDYRDADDACVELNGREMLGERSLEARRMAVTGLAGVHRIHLITGDERRVSLGSSPPMQCIFNLSIKHECKQKVLGQRSRSRSRDRSRSRSYERDRRRRDSSRRRSRSRSRSLPLESAPKRSRSIEKASKVDSPTKNGNSDVGSVSDSARRSGSYSRSPTPDENDKNVTFGKLFLSFSVVLYRKNDGRNVTPLKMTIE